MPTNRPALAMIAVAPTVMGWPEPLLAVVAGAAVVGLGAAAAAAAVGGALVEAAGAAGEVAQAARSEAIVAESVSSMAWRRFTRT